MAVRDKPFSWSWALISVVVFIAVELVAGGLIGPYLTGYKSQALEFTLQGVLHLGSFFLGGLLIGFLSPGIRILEPAVGAFISLAAMMAMTFFTPYTFIRFSGTKLLVGGAIAFVLALAGARAGEKLAGNRDV
jgi:peptidoglycan/LPS O-acetylase OafA/YrhL